MAVLIALLERPGELVTREALRSQIWPTGMHVEFDSGLNTAVRSLRARLCDSATGSRFIETVPRQGYRFIAPVSVLEGGSHSDTSVERVENLPRAVQARPARLTLPQRIGLVLAGLTVALFFAGWIATRFSRPAIREERSMVVVPLTSLPGDEMQPSFSPDGTQVVFRWCSPDFERSSLLIKKVGQSATRQLTDGAAMDASPVWSPEGSTIAFIRDSREVMTIPSAGGSARKVAEVEGDHISWIPNSSRLIVPARSPTTGRFWADTIDVNSGEHKLLLSQARGLNPYMPVLPSSNGSDVLYAAKADDRGNDLNIESLTSGSRRKLLHVTAALRGFAWSPDERSIICSSNSSGAFRLWRVRRADGQVTLLGSAGEESYFPVLGRLPLSVVEPGRLAYEKRDLSTHLYAAVLRRAGEIRDADVNLADSPLLPSTRIDSSPAISPNGSEICFVSDRSGYSNLWCSKFGEPEARQISFFTDSGPGSPKWHPSQRAVAFDLLSGEDRDIWIADVDTGKMKRVTNWGGNQVRPSWSADGRSIYFGSLHSGSQQIWKVRYDFATGSVGEPEPVTREGGFEGIESKDGRTLFIAGADKQGGLWSMPTSGGPAKRVFAGPIRNGWWNVGADGIYFVRVGERRFHPGVIAGKSVNYLSLRTGIEKQLFQLRKPIFIERPDFCVSPKENRVMVGQIDSENVDLMMIDSFR